IGVPACREVMKAHQFVGARPWCYTVCIAIRIEIAEHEPVVVREGERYVVVSRRLQHHPTSRAAPDGESATGGAGFGAKMPHGIVLGPEESVQPDPNKAAASTRAASPDRSGRNMTYDTIPRTLRISSTSLSPRPERFTTTRQSFPSAPPSRSTQASACADSS